jgi:hypothetical protein
MQHFRFTNFLSETALFLLVILAILTALVYIPFPKKFHELPSIESDEFKTTSSVVTNLPDALTVNQSDKVTVRISPNSHPSLFEKIEGGGDLSMTKAPPMMSAKVSLKGDDGFFEISLKNGDEEKSVGNSQGTDWIFEIVPKQAGDANLYLSIGAIWQDGRGNRSVKELPTIKKVRIGDDILGRVWVWVQANILTILGLAVALIVGLLAVDVFAHKVFGGPTTVRRSSEDGSKKRASRPKRSRKG